jgi:hypothetical protein
MPSGRPRTFGPRGCGRGSALDMNQGRELTPIEVEAFVEEGFVRLGEAFPRELAAEARAILWRDTGCDPDDASTWTKPVVRLGFYAQPPFLAAANTPGLHGAFDRLVGAGRWLPRDSLGTFPIRFPSPDDPGDAGWHVGCELRNREPRLHDMAGQRPLEGARAADAVLVLGCRAR